MLEKHNYIQTKNHYSIDVKVIANQRVVICA